jgi:hypothetical protein
MSGMGGNEEPNACFCCPPEIQNFFFFWTDVDDATSAPDGRGMDEGWTLRITLSSVLKEFGNLSVLPVPGYRLRTERSETKLPGPGSSMMV